LQDFRADPASIAKDFPLQLYLKERENENLDRR
jgi:hypothetical protein